MQGGRRVAIELNHVNRNSEAFFSDQWAEQDVENS